MVSELRIPAFKQVRGMYGTVIVQTADAALIGFGRNSFGSLGDGTIIQKTEPVAVAEEMLKVSKSIGIKDFDAGDHTVLLLNNNQIWTFGNNNKKQVYKYGAYRNVPVRVHEREFENLEFDSVYVGLEHSIAMTADNKTLYTWVCSLLIKSTYSQY